MKSDLIFKQLHHERVHCAASRRDQPQDIATVLFLGQGSFERFYLPANAASPHD
jgi:hypothetical protein